MVAETEAYARFFDSIRQKKTNIVKRLSKDILYKLYQTRTPEEADLVRVQYITNTFPEDEEIILLDEEIISYKYELTRKIKIWEESVQAVKDGYATRFRKEKRAREKTAAEQITMARQMRKELSDKYGAELITFNDLNNILFNYRKSFRVGKNYSIKDADYFYSFMRRMGYTREKKGALSNFETFKNEAGFEINTMIIEPGNGNKRIPIAIFIIENNPDVRKMYEMEMVSRYRHISRSTLEPETPPEFPSAMYVHEGEILYEIQQNRHGNLEIKATDNSDIFIPVVAENIEWNKIKVTPWTSRTSLWVKKGQKVELNATGAIGLGVFSVACPPSGISGFRHFNIDSRFNHGCLLGKIGDGEWFYVGENKTFVAQEEGMLQLRINDDKEADNSGHFKVSYNYPIDYQEMNAAK